MGMGDELNAKAPSKWPDVATTFCTLPILGKGAYKGVRRWALKFL